MTDFSPSRSAKCVLAGIVSSAFCGSRKVFVRFSPDGGGATRVGLNCLLDLLASKAIKIADHDEQFLAAVRDTLGWEADHNRTFVIEFTPEFDLDCAADFAARTQHALEHIAVV